MTEDPAHTANNTPSPTGKARATKPAPAATAAAPKEKPRGMSYGGVSAAQHALDRLERATGQSKHGRRP